MHRKRFVFLTAAAVVASMATGITASASAALSGAGSTLVAPLEAKWAQGYAATAGVQVSYQGVGSGTGITDITNGLVDFGASDAPLTSAQAAACPTCVEIPWALTATAIGFHLRGISTLKLTGPVLAKIYLGSITKWNNPAIKKLNKGVHLPNLAITPIHRSDGSGDTYAFTNYLSHVSSAWTSRVGPPATTIGFPGGVGGKGNSGVTAVLANTNGGIAYIAASYLIQTQGLGAAALENSAGNFEYPNIKEISNAAASVTSVTPNSGVSIVDPPRSAKIAYPLSTYTYVIVKKGEANVSAAKQFISYALTTGQAFGAKLDFAPIPNAILNAANSALNTL